MRGSNVLRNAGGSSLGHSIKGSNVNRMSRAGILPVAGYFYFQIDNWSDRILDQWPRNPVLSSEAHRLYGISWQLRVYPRGSLNDNSQFVEVQLVNMTSKDVQAKYTISIFDNNTQCYDRSWSDPDGIVSFCQHGNDDYYWGNCEFMALEELEAPPYMKDNTVRFKVDIISFIDDELGALTPTTSPMGDVKPGTSLEIAKSDLQQLSTHMAEQKVRMIKEEEEMQDSLVRNRICSMTRSVSGTFSQSFTL